MTRTPAQNVEEMWREWRAKQMKPFAGPYVRREAAIAFASSVLEQQSAERASGKEKAGNFTPNPVEWMTTIRNLLFSLGMKEEMSNWGGSFDGWGAAFEWIRFHVKRSQKQAAEVVRLREALQKIEALTFKQDERGRDDFYSGPGVFLKAWSVARAALAGTEEKS